MVPDLPLDLWLRLPLGPRDLAALAATCRALRAAMRAVACARGVRVSTARPDVLDAVASPAWRELAVLKLTGLPMRVSGARGQAVAAVPALAALRSLDVRHCRLPDGPFWPRVFEACPALRRVCFEGDFYSDNYARDVGHVLDLVAHVSRLESLDVEGHRMVVFPRPWTTRDPAIAAAVERVRSAPAAASDGLRRYRCACPQAPVGVDAPLRDLEVKEPTEPPLALARMGPRTLAATRRLTWDVHVAALDPSPLAGFVALRVLDLRVHSAGLPIELSRRLAGLSCLPRGLVGLRVRLDIWAMRTYDSDIDWGLPLAGLSALRTLTVSASFPPPTVGDLLARWMGAGRSVRLARAEFDETACAGFRDAAEHDYEMAIDDPGIADEDNDELAALRRAWRAARAPLSPAGLHAWLAARPAARVEILGLGGRLRGAHPRVSVL